MRILHIIPRIGGLTGAELYVSDLASIQAGDHDVAIYATELVKGKTLDNLYSHNVEIIDDLDDRFDVVHAHQAKSAMLGSLLDKPVVQTVHSELFPSLEYPLVHKNILHYICVRPTVQDYVATMVPEDMTSVIYNGIDENRFYEVDYTPDKKPTVLFAGPNDYLRKNAIQTLVERAEKDEILLILVGKGQDANSKNIISFPEMPAIETITQRVDQTASVMLGRTTIEGWLCGKPGIVFVVDKEGEIQYQDIHPAPHDITPFTLTYMYSAVMLVYEYLLTKKLYAHRSN